MTDCSRKSEDAATTARLDKYLWAARFFKTRSLASEAIKGGKVHLDGRRVKPGSAVRVGDRVAVTKGQSSFIIDVAALSVQRGPASRAERLYVETEASRTQRERRAADRRAARDGVPRPPRRPSKKQRRQLRQFKHGG